MAMNSNQTLNSIVQVLHENSPETCKIDMPSLLSCLDNPDVCTPTHLAHLVISHVQALKEFDNMFLADEGSLLVDFSHVPLLVS